MQSQSSSPDPIAVSSPDDATFESLVALNASVHGPDIGDLCRTLDRHLPLMRRDFWFAAKRPGSAEALSTACLIPTSWTYRHGETSVTLKAAEVAIVSTKESERGKGHCSAVMDLLERTARDNGFSLATIEGIPNFYRKFGYEYAVPLSVQVRLGPGLTPWREECARDDAPSEPPRWMTHLVPRKSRPDDIAFMAGLHERYCSRFQVCGARGPELWNYLENQAAESPETFVSRHIVSIDGRATGYIGVAPDPFGNALALVEAAVPAGLELEALALADVFRAEAGKAYLTVALPKDDPISRLAFSLGASERWEYAWQAKILDLEAFLETVRPVLESRLSASAFAGRGYRLELGLYSGGIAFDWDGKSLGIERCPDQEWTRFPRELLPVMALGYRSVAELRHLRHDVFVYRDDERLLDSIFPRTNSFVHQPY